MCDVINKQFHYSNAAHVYFMKDPASEHELSLVRNKLTSRPRNYSNCKERMWSIFSNLLSVLIKVGNDYVMVINMAAARTFSFITRYWETCVCKMNG
jgi:hypothetical protein